ncbi:hypothetical protein K9N50_01895 [bacterium]|nr:hypothetical protein [bacterium]
MIIILTALYATDQAECAWFTGCAVNTILINGNLDVKEIVPEYEVFLNYNNSFNAIYHFGVSSYAPKFENNTELKSLHATNCWFLRSVRIPIWRLNTVLSTGVGFSVLNTKNHNNKDVLLGSFSFRSDIELIILSRDVFEIVTGVTYRGCPVQGTGNYLDRFGIRLSIIG